MTQFIQAIYEGGVFRPLEPIQLAEHERVSLVVTGVDAQKPSTTSDVDVRRHFGAVRSGNPRSADNAQIDANLAREYEDRHE
jgi:predicted DNA-binding antitoxin AbrB/MazE fold protein